MEAFTALLLAIAAVIASVAVLVFVFRRPNAGLRVKHRDSEFEITPGPAEPKDQPPALPPGESLEQGAPSEESTEVEATETVELKNYFNEAHTHLVAGRYSEGMAVLEKEAEQEDTPAKARQLLNMGRYIASRSGSTEALLDLKEATLDRPHESSGHVWYGMALHDLHQGEEARATLEKALSTSDSEADRASALLWLSRSIARDYERGPAVARLRSEVSSFSDPNAKASILQLIGETLLGYEKPDLRSAFAALEASLELNPLNHELRFSLGLTYLRRDFPSMALLHFDRYVDRKADDARAMNNIGVASSNLDLEGQSVSWYERSAAKGDTLASANIAYKLISEGFVDEARTKLEQALGADDVHPNVLEALGELAKQQEGELKTRESVIARAVKVSKLVARQLSGPIPEGIDEPADLTDGLGRTLRLEGTLDGRRSGALNGGARPIKLSGVQDGRGFRFYWQDTPRQDQDTSIFRAEPKSGYGLLLFEDVRTVSGYSYEGSRVTDPWKAKGWTEWRFNQAAGDPA